MEQESIVERNDTFSLKCRYYDPKGDILDYWVTLIFCLSSYYIKVYRVERMDIGKISYVANSLVSV